MTQDAFFEIRDSGVQLGVPCGAQISFDCIHLTMQRDDPLRCRLFAHLMLDVADIVGERCEFGVGVGEALLNASIHCRPVQQASIMHW